MGQKVHPYAFRLGPQYTWKSRWFATGKQYRQFLQQDAQLRELLMDRLKLAGIMDVDIERSIKRILLRLYVTRPGVVIGRGGSGIEELKRVINDLLGLNPRDPKSPQVELLVEEVKNPELSAYLMAVRVADQLARRIPHHRVANKIMDQVVASGALGIKIVLSGRIGGSEIGRTEKFSKGSVPRQTIRADIDFARISAYTKSGYIGVKVWIHRAPVTN